ncbi:response regulator transcription factor [Candidatus Latescibacterota bacterium]
MNNKILIIDDNLDILETMEALLKKEGFNIFSADTVDKGIMMINEFSPDIILLDIMFPEKKTLGFEAASLCPLAGILFHSTTRNL